MENNDFDKLFSDKLQTTQEFDFQEEDWSNVASRLDEKMPVDTWSWRRLVVPFIILSLLGATVWLSIQLNDTSGELKELKEELENQTLQKRDTIVQTVILRDTIFAANSFKNNTHDIRRIGESGTPNSAGSFLFIAQASEKLELSPLTYRQSTQFLNPSKSSLGVFNKNNSAHLGHPSQLSVPNYLPYLSGNTLAINEVLDSTYLNRNLPIESSNPFQLQGAKLGLTVGNSFTPDNNLVSFSSYNFGLKTELLLAENVSLVGGIDFYNLKYQTGMNYIGGDIPTIPDDVNYEIADLFSVQSEQSFWQIKLGFKYAFPSENKVQPYIGLNYLASLNYQKDFYYLFDPAKYLEAEYTISSSAQEVTSSGFSFDLGVEYQPVNWLSIQFEGYYHAISQKMTSQYYDLVGLRTAVLYNF